jgi:hypothetical protein
LRPGPRSWIWIGLICPESCRGERGDGESCQAQIEGNHRRQGLL